VAGRTATGAEVKTTPIEQDVAQPSAPVDPPVVQAEADPRDSALANLLNGTPDPVITEDQVVAVDESNVIDFGGKSRAVVVFSRYHQFVDGIFTKARKGDVIDTDADSLKRGIRIGALRKLEG
jgi:hypothetical protein